MSKFLEVIGADIGSALLTSTHTAGGRYNYGNSSKTNVRRVTLDMNQMRSIQEFVDEEIDLKSAFEILNGFSLLRGMIFKFAGKELDEAEYALESPMREFLSRVRKWYMMFGFVAIRNPDLRAARLLSELQSEGVTPDAPTATNSNTTIDQPLDALQAIKNTIDDILSESEARRMKNDLFRNTSMAMDALEGSSVPPARRRVQSLMVQHMPSVTTLYQPSAIAIPIESGSTAPRLRDQAAPAAPAAAPTQRKRPNESQRRTYKRTVQEALVGLRNLTVVNLYDNEFAIEIDPLTLERRVVAMRIDPATKKRVVDTDVFVYVWSDRMPSDNGKLNTKIVRVMALSSELDVAKRNAASADFDSTHPIQPLEHLPTKNELGNVDVMTDQMLYGGQDSSQIAVENRQKIQQQAIALYTLGVAADVLNEKRRDQLSIAIAKRRQNSDRGVRDDPNAKLLARLDQADFFPLPPGFKVSTREKPVPIIDQAFLRYEYRQALASLAGVPLSFLDSGSSFSGRSTKGGSGTSTGSVSTASAGIGDKKLSLAIEQDREILGDFVKSLWNLMYRESDNETLRQVLTETTTESISHAKQTKSFVELVKRRLDIVKNVAELESLNQTLHEQRDELESLQSRLSVIQQRMLEIASMPFRFEIEFTDMSHIAPEQISFALENSAMTPLEAANSVRISIGLKRWSEQEFEKFQKEKEDKELDSLEKKAKLDKKYEKQPQVSKPATSSSNNPKAKSQK